MAIHPSSLVEFSIDNIDIERRQRRNLGDLDRLAASIAEVGLLQPILLTTKGKLIAGQRRLQAHRLLGRKTIRCCIVEHLHDACALLQAEIAENTCRQPFSPSEAVSAAELLLPLAQEAAWNRMIHHAPEERGEGASGNLPEGGRALEEVAKAVGLARRTLEKARAVMAAACEEPDAYRDLVERMDRTGKVNGAHQELLRRQGKLPPRTSAYFTVRMNVNGSVEISGMKNKQEILTHLHLLIRQMQLELGQKER